MGSSVHELKINPEFLQSIQMERKTFEIRKNDRNFKAGDVLILKGWVDGEYIGSQSIVQVTYLLSEQELGFGIEKGYVAMSIKVCKP